MNGPWFHTTNAELEPGTILEPRSVTGMPTNYPQATLNSDQHVYIWNDAVGVEPCDWGKYDYEVQPLGPVEPDSEGLANDDPDDTYMYEGSFMTTRAVVIRKLTA